MILLFESNFNNRKFKGSAKSVCMLIKYNALTSVFSLSEKDMSNKSIDFLCR